MLMAPALFHCAATPARRRMHNSLVADREPPRQPAAPKRKLQSRGRVSRVDLSRFPWTADTLRWSGGMQYRERINCYFRCEHLDPLKGIQCLQSSEEGFDSGASPRFEITERLF